MQRGGSGGCMCLRSCGSCRRWRRTFPQRSLGCGRRRTRWCCTRSCCRPRTTRGCWTHCSNGPLTSTPSPPSPSPSSTGQPPAQYAPLEKGCGIWKNSCVLALLAIVNEFVFATFMKQEDFPQSCSHQKEEGPGVAGQPRAA